MPLPIASLLSRWLGMSLPPRRTDQSTRVQFPVGGMAPDWGPSSRKVTILIPTFNRPAMLERALKSVIESGCGSLVLRVFDNGSTDEAKAVIDRLKTPDIPIHYQKNPVNIGPIANFQQALGCVTTEYFVPLADDDWLYPDFVANALAILEADRTLGAAIYMTQARDCHGNLLETYPQMPDQRRFGRLEPAEHLEDWLRFGHYAWSSILWRRSVLETVGAPFLHAGLPSDVDFQLRVFTRFPIFRVNQPGAGYLIHEGQGGAALSACHLADWARIFLALDRSVAGEELLSQPHYAALRKMALSRYRPLWRRGLPEKAPEDLEDLAIMAGVCLDDWDYALDLLRQADAKAERSSPCAGFDPPRHWTRAGLGDRAPVPGQVGTECHTRRGADEGHPEARLDAAILARLRSCYLTMLKVS